MKLFVKNATLKLLILAIFMPACKKGPQRPFFQSLLGTSNSDCETAQSDQCPNPVDTDDDDLKPDIDPEVSTEDPEQPIEDPAKPSASKTKEFSVSFDSVKIQSPSGGKPTKGEPLHIVINLKNLSLAAGNVKITPILTALDYDDFSAVTLSAQSVAVEASATKQAKIAIPVFFENSLNKKQYALNRGQYKLSINLEVPNQKTLVIAELPSLQFEVSDSNVVFTAVLWEQSFLDKQQYKGTIEKYLEETWSHPSEVFAPTTKNGDFGYAIAYPDGFNQITNTRTLFKAFKGFDVVETGSVDYLKEVGQRSQKALGLTGSFAYADCPVFTHKQNHGFDIAAGLSANEFGGIGFICGNMLASGMTSDDRSEKATKIILIHETGHNYGADHCDPLSTYVMCSGEKHDAFKSKGLFVWHQNSIDAFKLRAPSKFTLTSALANSVPAEQKASVKSCKFSRSVP
jgi:hypothetical protein